MNWWKSSCSLSGLKAGASCHAANVNAIRKGCFMDIDEQGLRQLLLMQLELLDSTFDMWMSATFAVLIAIHFVGRQLKTRALVLIATLYSIFRSSKEYRE